MVGEQYLSKELSATPVTEKASFWFPFRKIDRKEWSTMKIDEIEKLYPDWYKPDFELSRDDQGFIWENTPLTEEENQRLRELETIGNVDDYKSVYSGSKYGANENKNQTKIQAVKSLRKCDIKTAPMITAEHLGNLFGIWEKRPEHWLILARQYTPKAINSVILEIIKAGKRGAIDLRTPGQLFTYLLTTFHKPRRHPKRRVYRKDVTRNEYGIYKVLKPESEKRQ